MNTFDVSKRNISTYEQFLKDREKAEDAEHEEKGEHPLVKKAMSGEVDGKKGYAVLDENLSEDNSGTTWGNPENLKIFNTISGSSFEKWYDKDFNDFIAGDEKAKSKTDILKDIFNLFKI
jgi:hypothetical protein